LSQWVGGPQKIKADQGTKPIHGQGELAINKRMLEDDANWRGKTRVIKSRQLRL
jgi:hypothetical protein